MHLTHRQEQFSNAFIEAVAAVAGCSAAQNSVDNDSIDWTLSNRLPRRPNLDIQLKCTGNAGGPQENIRFPLLIKNYRDLILTDSPIPGSWLSSSCPKRSRNGWGKCPNASLSGAALTGFRFWGFRRATMRIR